MNKRMIYGVIIKVSLVSLLLAGCTQMPTERQGVSDMRPQISFQPGDERVHSFRVIIDGLDMGAVGDYVDGASTMRILQGTHRLQIRNDLQFVLDDKFYVGDGASRSFVVK